MNALLIATDPPRPERPLADSAPGPLLPVVNRPVIDYALEAIARAGLRDLLVCLCRRSARLAAYLGDGRRWGLRLRVVAIDDPWLEAAAAARVAGLLTGTTLALPADALVDLDIPAALAAHRAGGAALSLIDAADRTTGAFVVEPAALAQVPAGRPFGAAELAAARGPAAQALDLCSYYNPLGSAAEYLDAQRVALYSAAGMAEAAGLPTLRHARVEGAQIRPGVWVGPNSRVHPRAHLAAPCAIGAAATVAAEAEVGPEAVLGPHCVVDREATVRASTVAEGTYVGRLTSLAGKLAAGPRLVDGESGEAVEVAEAHLLADLRDAPASLSGLWRGLSLWVRRARRANLALSEPVEAPDLRSPAP